MRKPLRFNVAEAQISDIKDICGTSLQANTEAWEHEVILIFIPNALKITNQIQQLVSIPPYSLITVPIIKL